MADAPQICPAHHELSRQSGERRAGISAVGNSLAPRDRDDAVDGVMAASFDRLLCPCLCALIGVALVAFIRANNHFILEALEL